MYKLNVSDFEVAKLIPDSWFRNPVLVSVSFRVSVRNECEQANSENLCPPPRFFLKK